MFVSRSMSLMLKPFDLRVLVADVGRIASLPTGNRIDVMQRISIDVPDAAPGSLR